MSNGEKYRARSYVQDPLGKHCLDGHCETNVKCREKCEGEGYTKGGKCEGLLIRKCCCNEWGVIIPRNKKKNVCVYWILNLELVIIYFIQNKMYP